MKAFITGSHAYGRPSSKSDIDLVVLADQFAADKLRALSESTKTVRFGRLNIILCFTENEFEAWKTTTDRLSKVHEETGAIYDKVAAHVEFERDRERFGVQYKGDSGEEYSPEETIPIEKDSDKQTSADPFGGLL